MVQGSCCRRCGVEGQARIAGAGAAYYRHRPRRVALEMLEYRDRPPTIMKKMLAARPLGGERRWLQNQPAKKSGTRF
jgi:hypothetical protein